MSIEENENKIFTYESTEDCLHSLSDIIMNKVEYEKYKFHTFASEPSTGKTYTIIHALGKLYKPFVSNKRVLIVTQKKQEGIELQNQIRELVDKDSLVFAYNSSLLGDREFYIKKSKEAKVLIITHAMYIQLSLLRQEHYLWESIENRDMLIIDEQINGVRETFYTVSKNDLEHLEKIIGSNSELTEKFDNIIRPLLSMLNELNEVNFLYVKNIMLEDKKFTYKNNKNVNITPQNFVSNLLREMNEGYITEEYLERKNLELNTNLSYDSLNKLCMNILALFNNPYVKLTKEHLSSFEYNFKFLMFETNILLDATSNIDHIYRLSDKFILHIAPRELSHENCKMNIYPINSSKSNRINNITDYTKRISELIKRKIIQNNYSKENNKILIMGEKFSVESLVDERKSYLGRLLGKSLNEDGAIIEGKYSNKKLQDWKLVRTDQTDKDGNLGAANYSDMRGINTYKDFDVFYSITLPREKPLTYYILLCEFYLGKKLDEFDMIASKRTDESTGHTYYGFHNCKVLNEIFLSQQVATLIQGIYRVQRNKNPKSEYNLFMKDNEIIQRVLEEMYHMTNVEIIEDCKEFNDILQKERKERNDKGITRQSYNNANREENSNSKKLYEYLLSLNKGEYKKVILRSDEKVLELLNCKEIKPNYFSQLLKETNNILIKNKINNIIFKGQKIIIS